MEGKPFNYDEKLQKEEQPSSSSSGFSFGGKKKTRKVKKGSRKN